MYIGLVCRTNPTVGRTAVLSIPTHYVPTPLSVVRTAEYFCVVFMQFTVWLFVLTDWFLSAVNKGGV